jgi:hypothetical protein
MMRMTIRKALPVILLLCISFPSFSQKKDFGIYYGLNGEIKIVKNLEFDLSANIRTLDNASKISQIYIDGGLMYKFNKILSAGAGYRFTEFFEDDDLYHPRHRWYSELRVKLPAGDFEFFTRIRFQQSFKTYFENESDKEPYESLRFRLKALYNIPSFPVNPYIAAESYLPLFSDTERKIEKNRFMAGAEYKISKKHSVELEYMFQRDFIPKIKDRNIISVNYNFKF